MPETEVTHTEQVERLEAEVRRLRMACARTEDTVQQILGKAFGFPWFQDDQDNFPGATVEDGVLVAPYIAEDLANMAVMEIEYLRYLVHSLTRGGE